MMTRVRFILALGLLAVLLQTAIASAPYPPSFPTGYTLVFSEEIPEEDVLVQVTEAGNFITNEWISIRASPRGSSFEVQNPAWGTAIVLNNVNGTSTCVLFKGLVSPTFPSPAPLMRGNFKFVDYAYVNMQSVAHWRWTINFVPGQILRRVGLYADLATGHYVSFAGVGGLSGWYTSPLFNATNPDPSLFELPPSCNDPANPAVVVEATETEAGEKVTGGLSGHRRTHKIAKTFENLEKAYGHVRGHDAVGRGYSLKVHDMAHAGVEHFQLNIKPRKVENVRVHTREELANAPESIDWRAQGFVTSIRNQGSCGSCWAFSTAAALEVAYAVQQNQSVSHFSVQSILDCTPLGSGLIQAKACYGGWQPTAMSQIIENGIPLESAYPYEGVSAQCRLPQMTDLVKPLTSFSALQGEDGILAALSTSAVVVIVEVSSDFFFYESGILDDPLCGDRLDHGVIVVGYGQNATGTPYWIVKNSFGAGWGENGYIRIIRGKNMCGIGNYPWQPEWTA